MSPTHHQPPRRRRSPLVRNLIGALVLVVGTLLTGTASAEMLDQLHSPGPHQPLHAHVLSAPMHFVTLVSRVQTRLCEWHADLLDLPAPDRRP